MGFSPAQVREMTFWEFGHAATAFAAFNGAKLEDDPTASDMAALDEMMANAPQTMH